MSNVIPWNRPTGQNNNYDHHPQKTNNQDLAFFLYQPSIRHFPLVQPITCPPTPLLLPWLPCVGCASYAKNHLPPLTASVFLAEAGSAFTEHDANVAAPSNVKAPEPVLKTAPPRPYCENNKEATEKQNIKSRYQIESNKRKPTTIQNDALLLLSRRETRIKHTTQRYTAPRDMSTTTHQSLCITGALRCHR